MFFRLRRQSWSWQRGRRSQHPISSSSNSSSARCSHEQGVDNGRRYGRS